MNYTIIRCSARLRHFLRPFVTFLILPFALVTLTFAKDVGRQNNPALVRVTHLLGFANAAKNAKGTLAIQPDTLQFQKSGRPGVQIKIGSIQDVLVGERSREIGGIPMTLGKAALPYSGGRVVSLFAHKKYDTLTLEYLDGDGGFHGAVFELKKGQAEHFRDELVRRGARVSNTHSQPTKQIAEAMSENK